MNHKHTNLKVALIITSLIFVAGLVFSYLGGHAGWASEPTDLSFNVSYLILVAAPAGIATVILAILLRRSGNRAI